MPFRGRAILHEIIDLVRRRRQSDQHKVEAAQQRSRLGQDRGDDMVDGVLLAMIHPKAVGESFNIGNQRAVETIYGLANTVIRVVGSKSPINFTRKDYVDIELRVPSVVKSRALLGFEAKIDLEEGIRRTAEYYREEAIQRTSEHYQKVSA